MLFRGRKYQCLLQKYFAFFWAYLSSGPNGPECQCPHEGRWYLANNNKYCIQDNGTRCDSSKFTCLSGKCIPDQLQCNDIDDCGDSSDELETLCGELDSWNFWSSWCTLCLFLLQVKSMYPENLDCTLLKSRNSWYMRCEVVFDALLGSTSEVHLRRSRDAACMSGELWENYLTSLSFSPMKALCLHAFMKLR